MTTNAPLFRTLDQLTGQRSGVTAVLDAADKVHQACCAESELSAQFHRCDRLESKLAAAREDKRRLTRDNAKLREQVDGLAEAYERLVEENAGLRCRLDELDGLQAEMELTRGRLISAKDELESLRSERDTWRAGVSARLS